MNPSDLSTVIGTIVAALCTLGAGAKWVVMYINAQQAKAALAESTARAELSARLHDEIRVLRGELNALHVENRIYLRRIFQLEGVIHNHPDIPLPTMEGWPPK